MRGPALLVLMVCSSEVYRERERESETEKRYRDSVFDHTVYRIDTTHAPPPHTGSTCRVELAVRAEDDGKVLVGVELSTQLSTAANMFWEVHGTG